MVVGEEWRSHQLAWPTFLPVASAWTVRSTTRRHSSREGTCTESEPESGFHARSKRASAVWITRHCSGTVPESELYERAGKASLPISPNSEGM